MPEYTMPRRRKPPSAKAAPQAKPNSRTEASGKQAKPIRTKAVVRTQKPAKASRPAKTSHNNRRRKQNMAIYYMMFLLVTTIVFSILATTVLFNLETVYAEGDSVYSEEEILNTADITLGVNLVRFNTEESRNKIIEGLVYIDDVQINKKFPNKLEIKVTGAQEMAGIEHNGRYYIISRNGRILRELNRSQRSSNLIIYGYYAQVMEVGGYIESADERQTELIYNIIQTAEDTGLDGIVNINITDLLDIKINYMDRVELSVGAATELELKLRAAVKILDDEINPAERGTLRLIDPLKIAFQPEDY